MSNAANEKLPVKIGIGVSDKQMTRKQALSYGKRIMPADLKRAGFEVRVSRSDPEMHGGDWFRVNYCHSY
jgi:hypothetical protein